jgi:hypothetical protein
MIKRIADSEVLWSLKSADGWVLASDDKGTHLVPVWPAERFAQACADGFWAGSVATPITLGDWLAKWLPGIARDNRQVAVFPTPRSKGALVLPEKFQADLQEELKNYE